MFPFVTVNHCSLRDKNVASAHRFMVGYPCILLLILDYVLGECLLVPGSGDGFSVGDPEIYPQFS